jgi:hypothetical protein
VGIVSLDHVLFSNNHLWFHAPPITTATDALLFGITVQASNNRMQEAAGFPALFSGFTLGIANCVVGTGAKWQVNTPNIEMDTTLCPNG